MAARADTPHTHNKGSSGVNAIDNAKVNVVAAGGGRLANGQGCNRGGGHRGVGCGSRDNRPTESQVSRHAREAASLCASHWRYGKQAYGCKSPSTVLAWEMGRLGPAPLALAVCHICLMQSLGDVS
jgi:hypothetical protein